MTMLQDQVDLLLVSRLPADDALFPEADARLSRLAADILAECETAQVPDGTIFRVVQHLHALYASDWRLHAGSLTSRIEKLLRRQLERPDPNVDLVCTLYDCAYFFYWARGTALSSQADFADKVVRPVSDAVVRRAALRRRQPAPKKLSAGPVWRLGYLCEFAHTSPGNAMAPVAEWVIKALGRFRDDRYRIVFYPWMHSDEPFLARIHQSGITVRTIAADRPKERLLALERQIDEDQIDVLISDMNAAVPTLLFERRAAPVQVFYQMGMPFWPLRQLDAVMRTWEFEPRIAGFDPDKCFTASGPWVLDELAPPVDPDAVACERARLPVGKTIIGTYGRLAKITPDYLDIVASLVARHPGIHVAIGGTGDATPILDYVAHKGIKGALTVCAGYVDGQVWGHVLDVFLDTFPLQGGASCWEVIAKGKPVVSMVSADMSNFATQRVGALVAASTADYYRIVSRLVEDDAFYSAMCEATCTFAASRPGLREYAAAIDRAVTAAISRSKATPRHDGWISRLRTRLMTRSPDR